MKVQKKTISKADIIDIIAKESRNRNRILDVGSGRGEMLFLAEKVGFKHLIGFDKNVCPHIGILELKAKEANMSYENYCTKVNCELPNFLVVTSDYKDFPLEEYTYDCVILNHFLHFLPDGEKYVLIERLFALMEPDGLITIKVNHNKNRIDTAATHAVNISGNTWESKNVFKERRYLVDAEEFTAYLDSKYLLLKEYSYINPDRDIFYIIRKC